MQTIVNWYVLLFLCRMSLHSSFTHFQLYSLEFTASYLLMAFYQCMRQVLHLHCILCFLGCAVFIQISKEQWLIKCYVLCIGSLLELILSQLFSSFSDISILFIFSCWRIFHSKDAIGTLAKIFIARLIIWNQIHKCN